MIANPYEWQLLTRRPGKEIWSRFDPHTDQLVIRETWVEDACLEQAAQQRELAESDPSKEFKPLAVIPDSVMSQAINEGWDQDDQQWKRWMNDIDNRYLRITGGVA